MYNKYYQYIRHHGEDTGSYVSAVKDAIAAIVAAIPEITIINYYHYH
jgi:hypothetical protein